MGIELRHNDLRGTNQRTIKKKRCLLTYHTGAIELRHENMQIDGRREGKWRVVGVQR